MSKFSKNHFVLVLSVLMILIYTTGCSDSSGDDNGVADQDTENVVDGDKDLPAEQEVESEIEKEIEVIPEIEEESNEFNTDVDFEADLPEVGEIEVGECQLPAGNEVCRYCGMPCEESLDCPNGYECNGDICTRGCNPGLQGDCGSGWSCQYLDLSVVSRPGKYLCVRSEGGECKDNNDCTATNEVCTEFWPGKKLDEIKTLCTPENPCATKNPTESCNASNQCLGGKCLDQEGGDICSVVCNEDADCTGGTRCRDAYFGQYVASGGIYTKQLLVPMCQKANQGLNCNGKDDCAYEVCTTNEDCTGDDEICAGKLKNDRQNGLVSVCMKKVEGGLGFGEECDFKIDSKDCESLICAKNENAGKYYCAETCNLFDNTRFRFGNKSCAAGANCVRHEFPKEPAKPQIVLQLDLCMPVDSDFKNCSKNTECGDGEVCAGIIESNRSPQLQGHCVPQMGDRKVGENCGVNQFYSYSACETGFCLEHNSVSSGLCSALCEVDADCPTEWKCKEYPDHTGLSLKLCQPDNLGSPKGDLCEKNEDCEDNTDGRVTCSNIIEETASRGEIKAYCDIPKGRAKIGEQCDLGAEFTETACETGFCLDNGNGVGICSAFCTPLVDTDGDVEVEAESSESRTGEVDDTETVEEEESTETVESAEEVETIEQETTVDGDTDIVEVEIEAESDIEAEAEAEEEVPTTTPEGCPIGWSCEAQQLSRVMSVNLCIPPDFGKVDGDIEQEIEQSDMEEIDVTEVELDVELLDGDIEVEVEADLPEADMVDVDLEELDDEEIDLTDIELEESDVTEIDMSI